jgi:translation initiation factor 2 subunit 1
METLLKTIPYYTSKTPSMDSLVIADVYEFNDVIVNCTLPEFCGMEAILPTTEIKVKRGKAVRNYIKKGQQIVAQVIRIDELGRVDLSLKAVRADEEEAVLDKYHKTLKVLQAIATASNYNYDKTIELHSITHDQAREYESPYQYLEACLVGEDTAPSPEIQQAIQKRFVMPSYTCEKEVSLRFSEPNGVELITKQLNTWCEKDIQVFVLSPPKYKLVATANSKVKAQAILDSVVSS